MRLIYLKFSWAGFTKKEVSLEKDVAFHAKIFTCGRILSKLKIVKFTNKKRGNRNSLLALFSSLECERGGVFELVKIYDVFEDINQETSLELEKYIKIGKILKENDFVKAIDTTIQKERKDDSYPRPFTFIEASAGRGKTQIGQTLYHCCSTAEFKYIYVHFGNIIPESQEIYKAFTKISVVFNDLLVQN